MRHGQILGGQMKCLGPIHINLGPSPVTTIDASIIVIFFFTVVVAYFVFIYVNIICKIFFYLEQFLSFTISKMVVH